MRVNGGCVLEMEWPTLIAHRGAPLRAPENTLASLRSAKALGAKWVEFDVCLTRDHRAIIFHDDTLERTSNLQGYVSQTDYEVIRRADAGGWFDARFVGEPIPTLAQYLQCADALNVGINIELKGGESPEVLAQCVLRDVSLHWGDTRPQPLISSASVDCLQALRSQRSEFPCAYIMDVWSDEWVDVVTDLDCVAVHVNYETLNGHRIDAVKAAHKKIVAYTVNDKSIANALYAMGVDAIFSDDPQLLAESRDGL